MKNVYEKVALGKRTHSQKKEMPSQIFFNKFPLILSSFLWYFLILRRCLQKLTEIIQLTYLVTHEISCRYFFNGFSVHRGYNSLPEWNFLLTPESFEVLRWDFLKSIITSKPHPSVASTNALMTYFRLLCSLD